MTKPWSKLQKRYYSFRAEGLDIQLHCNAHRMQYQRGNTPLSRYWITLGKEITTKIFNSDVWGLIDILRASDRRVGIERLKMLKLKTNDCAVNKVIDARLSI